MAPTETLVFVKAGSEGQFLRHLRHAVGWSQTETAKAAGMRQQDLSMLERDELPLRWPSIQRLYARVEAVLRQQLAERAAVTTEVAG